MTSPLQQKIKITGPSVVTANRLADGAVVYRTADGSMDDGYRTARRRLDRTGRQPHFLRPPDTDGLRAVDVYLAPVKLERNRVLPGNLRELIRLRGPTIDLPVTFGI